MESYGEDVEENRLSVLPASEPIVKPGSVSWSVHVACKPGAPHEAALPRHGFTYQSWLRLNGIAGHHRSVGADCAPGSGRGRTSTSNGTLKLSPFEALECADDEDRTGANTA